MFWFLQIWLYPVVFVGNYNNCLWLSCWRSPMKALISVLIQKWRFMRSRGRNTETRVRNLSRQNPMWFWICSRALVRSCFTILFTCWTTWVCSYGLASDVTKMCVVWRLNALRRVTHFWVFHTGHGMTWHQTHLIFSWVISHAHWHIKINLITCNNVHII